MTDPTRWSEGSEASELERELLVAGQSVRLPENERRALWAGIALSLPIAAAPPTTRPAAVATGAGLGAYLTKGVIFLAAIGGLTFGAARLWPHSEHPAGVGTAPLAAADAHVADAAPVASTTPAATPDDVATAAVAAGSNEPKQRTTTASQLREESVAVLEARAALRSGDAAKSLSLLEQTRARFPRGALGQEREALTIQALAQSGQGSAAQRRAEAFLLAHPTSPYAADVRRIAGQ